MLAWLRPSEGCRGRRRRRPPPQSGIRPRGGRACPRKAGVTPSGRPNPVQAPRREASGSPHAIDARRSIRRMPMALSALVAARTGGDPLAGRARCVSGLTFGAGGLLLVDRVAPRRRPDARVHVGLALDVINGSCLASTRWRSP